MTTPKIVELRPYLDIAGAMRRVADAIEAGEHGNVRLIAAVMIHDGEATLFGWGEGSDLEIMGALAIGHHRALKDDGPR